MRTFLTILLLLAGITSCNVFRHKKPDKNQQKLNEVEIRAAIIDAKRMYVLGYKDSSAIVLKSILKRYPNNDLAMYELAKIFKEINLYPQAIMVLKKACAINKKNPWYWALLTELHQNLGQWEEASQACTLWFEADNKSRSALAILIMLYEQQKLYTKSLAALERLEQLSGGNIELSSEKIILLQKIGDRLGEEQEYIKLITNYPFYNNTYLQLAEFYQKNNKTDNAEQILKQASEVFPHNGTVQKKYGLFLRSIHKNESADIVFKKIIDNEAIDPDYKVTILEENLALKYANFDSIMHKELFDTFCKISINSKYIIRYKANYYNQINKKDSAIYFLEKELDNSPDNFTNWVRLLKHTNDVENYQKLYLNAKRALEYFPLEAMFYYHAAFASYKLKKFDEGLDYIKQGEEIIYDNIQTSNLLKIVKAEIYYKKKEYKLGDETFDEILSTEPDNELVLNNYSYYLALRGEKLEKAEEMAKASVKKQANNPSFLDTWAWVLFKLNKINEAKEIIEKALLNGGNKKATIVEHYGDILYKSGDTKGALTNWNLAKQLPGFSKTLQKKIDSKQFFEE